ncbi:DNA topoisomerase VI subunit B [Candidatus Woesearchaeota archaeon]|nr:DNA topoisomerase VI subunit B [Candidatus Woesearchaeota archaeon]
MVKTKAEELALEQREISVAAFFEKNRHLLGFDNPLRALSTTVKELVDNSLDACEEMKVLPEVKVEVRQVNENRFVVSVQDNGPGIVKEQIPKVFAKLLYGSKFFRMQQGRGQQGIGVSASVLYGQLTTGKPSKIISKIGKGKPGHYYELRIDIHKNEPEIVKDEIVNFELDHGTKVEIELEGKYQKGKQSVDEYLKQTAIANPHLYLIYINPLKEKIDFPRVVNNLPKEPKAIKPHPYGVEIGVLLRMLKGTKAKNLLGFFEKEFSRVSRNIAKEICDKSKVDGNMKPQEVHHDQAEALVNSIKNTKISSPPLNCLSPIGEEALLKGLQKEIKADFYGAVTRRPSVYRGFPFQVEAACVYGGELNNNSEELVRVMRFANKVPLQYQQSACAITKSAISTAWKNYGISQSKGALPTGPLVIVVHIASVWVPFTSEAKEAIAHYPEIIKEIKLALQEVGRKVGGYIRKTVKAREQAERANLFEKYIPELSGALSNLSGEKKTKIEENLNKVLKKSMKDILAGVDKEIVEEVNNNNNEKPKKEEKQSKLR